MKDIPQNIKVVISSVAPLVIVVILFFVVGNFGIAKITDIRAQVANAQRDQNILSQKATLLETVSQTLGNSPDLAATALPEDNASLLVISQLKNISFASGVILSNIKGGPQVPDPSGLSRADINFEVDGSRSQVISYLKALTKMAPITVIDKVKINEVGGGAKAAISIKAYWSPLPKTLPPVDQALSDLTPDERNVLAAVATLTQPVFSAVPAGTAAGKTDPFAP